MIMICYVACYVMHMLILVIKYNTHIHNYSHTHTHTRTLPHTHTHSRTLTHTHVRTYLEHGVGVVAIGEIFCVFVILLYAACFRTLFNSYAYDGRGACNNMVLPGISVPLPCPYKRTYCDDDENDGEGEGGDEKYFCIDMSFMSLQLELKNNNF